MNRNVKRTALSVEIVNFIRRYYGDKPSLKDIREAIEFFRYTYG